TGEKRTVDVNSIIEQTLFLLKHHERFKRLTVKREFGSGLPPVLADPERIIQSFMALMLNALDAMNSRGVLTVRSGRNPDRREELLVEFIDTGGIGIVDRDDLGAHVEEQVRVVVSDAWSALEGETFDLIVAHPPYVPALAHKYDFRDAGGDGEVVSHAILAGVPVHLRQGGRVIMRAAFSDRKGATIAQRVRHWLGDAAAEFDLVQLESIEYGPLDAYKTVTKGGPGFVDLERWMLHFHALEIERFCVCVLELRREAHGRARSPSVASLANCSRRMWPSGSSAWSRWLASSAVPAVERLKSLMPRVRRVRASPCTCSVMTIARGVPSPPPSKRTGRHMAWSRHRHSRRPCSSCAMARDDPTICCAHFVRPGWWMPRWVRRKSPTCSNCWPLPALLNCRSVRCRRVLSAAERDRQRAHNVTAGSRTPVPRTRRNAVMLTSLIPRGMLAALRTSREHRACPRRRGA
ncbi:MAG: hypothetical protein HC937_02640, partial [Aquincola sp.]|nr:hypothetical protein [Aquincola sp.]